MSEHNLIDVHGIAKTFHSKLLRRPNIALRGLDLAVGEGEVYGFLGPNGAGKTTTIMILLGLIRPTSGTGTVLGQPFGSVGARRELGFLPDSPNFYRYLTAREFLGLAGRLHDIPQAELSRRIDETLDRVRLAENARDRALGTYSRGMLQRTGIAAAILHRPRLVIMDEPMNGLDPIGRHELRDLILALRRQGATVFLSSHVLGDIENLADRVGIIHGGQLLRSGSLAEILAGDGRLVELSFELDPGPTLQQISPQFDWLNASANGWFGRVRSPERAQWVAGKILEGGGRLVRFERSRMSLEEFFVEQIARVDPPAVDPRASSVAVPALGPEVADPFDAKEEVSR